MGPYLEDMGPHPTSIVTRDGGPHAERPTTQERSMPEAQFDVIVLGAGPAGENAAETAARLGCPP